jgi:cysteine desulfurase
VNGSKDGFYNMLNVLLPFRGGETAMILFNLDMKGIGILEVVLARGSIRASHVLSEMLSDEDLRRPSLRISLSHYNSKEDIDTYGCFKKYLNIKSVLLH